MIGSWIYGFKNSGNWDSLASSQLPTSKANSSALTEINNFYDYQKSEVVSKIYHIHLFLIIISF